MKIYPLFGLWPFICKFSFYMDMMKGCKKHSKCAGFKESCNNSCQFFFGTNLGLLAIYPYFNSLISDVFVFHGQVEESLSMSFELSS